MKSLHVYVLVLGLSILQPFSGMAQSIAEQRVERYLFSFYDANKSGMKENDRTIAYLKERLEDYILSLNKESLERMRLQEAEFNRFLTTVDQIKDQKVLEKMVEESKAKNKVLISSIMENGIKSRSEALACRKIILFKIIELDMMKAKNEKLVALLKDTAYRGKFISSVVGSGEIHEETDIRSLMLLVDKNLSDFNI